MHHASTPPRPRHALALLGTLVCLAAPVVQAADLAAGWGSAFRPKALPAPVPAAPAAGASGVGATPAGDLSGGLKVMVLGRERPLASINGRIVHVGDRIDGMQVLQISRQGVLLQGEGPNRQRLQIAPSVLKLNRSTSEPAPRAGVRP